MREKIRLRKKGDDAVREINATSDLREVMDRIYEYEQDGVPLDMRFGMYSGNRVYNEGLLPIYFSVIEQRYRNPTVERVKKEMKKFAESPQNPNPATADAAGRRKSRQKLRFIKGLSDADERL